MKEAVLLSNKIWLPPMNWQQKIKESAEQLIVAKPDIESTGLQLDALVSATLDRAFKGSL